MVMLVVKGGMVVMWVVKGIVYGGSGDNVGGERGSGGNVGGEGGKEQRAVGEVLVVGVT